jgi:phosphoenolpyruvate synthase/pyruvate phosphate dikinase
VFFRSRRHRSPRNNPRAADHSDAGSPETTLQQTQQLQHWRRSAQRVTRAWNAWLAAENRDRAIRYRGLMAALADEEKSAAEVQRMIDLADAGQRVAATDPGEEEPWARALARF